MHFNINGGLDKKLELKCFVNFVCNFDIILLSECWIKENSIINLKGYECIKKVRVMKKKAKCPSGGMVIYIKSCLFGGVANVNIAFEDGLCLRLNKEYFGWENNVFIVHIYLKGEQSPRMDLNDGVSDFDKLLDLFSDISSDGSGILLSGDLNAHCGNIERREFVLDDELSPSDDFIFTHNYCDEVFNQNIFSLDEFYKFDISLFRKSQDKSKNTYGSKLIELCRASGLIMLNGRKGEDRDIGKFTFHNHIGKAIDDYMICNKNALQFVSNFKVDDPNIYSDHCVISCVLSCNRLTNDSLHTNITEPTLYCKWNANKKESYKLNINCSAITMELENISLSLKSAEDKQGIDNCIVKLTDLIVFAGGDHIHVHNNKGSNFIKRTNAIWYDFECREQRTTFLHTAKDYKNSNLTEDRLKMCKERSKYRRLCRAKKRIFNRKEAENLLLLSKRNSKQFWKQLKSTKVQSPLPNLNFHEHFKELFSRPSTLGEDAKLEIDSVTNYRQTVEFLDNPFNMTELNCVLESLKLNKSPGQDHIVNEFLINANMQLKQCLLDIFNKILDTEYFPTMWSEGTITPIFKKGDKSNTNNYRGITILSNIGKLFTKMVNIRLTQWFNDKKGINESQFGFRENRSTTDCIFILNGLIDILFAQGKKLYASFFDYTKAFDLIDRSAIYYKLMNKEISSKMLNVIRSLYSEVKLSVKGDENRKFYSNFGVLQGNSLSPLLFSLFVSDLPEYLSDAKIGTKIQDIIVKVLMFADDTAIFSETIEGLQEGINSVSKYCKKWGITVNVEKTKIVVFKKGGRLASKEKWVYRDKNIEVVNQFKYLGCTLSPRGKADLSVFIDSARRGLFSLYTFFNSNPEILPKLKVQLFMTMIVPILTNCTEVWGVYNIDSIESFHLSFLKNVLGVKKSTPGSFVYGEFGVYPLRIEIQIRVLKYWLKIIRPSMTYDNYVRKIYLELMLTNIYFPEKITWVTKVRDILFKCGMGFYWLRQKVCNENLFLNNVRQRLTDIYRQEWHCSIQDTSNNRIYKYLKNELTFEHYLNLPNQYLRIAITKIRLSSHLFNIERGRWKKVPLNERICDLCNVVEDEYHVFIECPRYKEIRGIYLPRTIITKPSMFAFINLFKCKNFPDIIKFGKLCAGIQKEHKIFL